MEKKFIKPLDIDTSKILFTEIHAELFNSVAKRTAETIATNRKANKPTQIRKFFDEIVMWDLKVSSPNENFKNHQPFIMMLNAKAAYAKGRKLVDENYLTLLSHCLKQVENPETMRTFKLFMEAFMGFYKELEP
jgi:CRISPR-associated protein Csm2